MTNTYFGISTILFCRDLPNEEAENLIRGKGFKKTYNPRIDSCEYVNKHYADQGVQITVSKFNDSPWSLYVYVNPPLVLGNRGSYCSIVPNYTAFVAAINNILSEVNSPHKLCSMKINRITTSVDWKLSGKQEVEQYLRVIQQAFVPSQYGIVRSLESDVKDPEKHIYCQSCHRITFCACDNVALSERDVLFRGVPSKKKTLHLELSLRRGVIRRIVGKKMLQTHRMSLMMLGGKTKKMMVNQLKQMKLLADSYVSYDEAVKAIDRVEDKDVRERMNYLLKKTRSLGGLTPAVDKLKDKYSLNKQQVNQVFKEFAKLEISPITVEDVGEKPLPGLGVLLKEIYE